MVALLALALAGALPARAESWIAPGVTFWQWDDGSPRRISVLRVDLCTPGVRIHATRSEERAQVTSSWGSNRGMVAAVNGGFFYYGSYDSHGAAMGGDVQWGDPAYETGFVAFGPHAVAMYPFGGYGGIEGWMEEVVSGSAPILQGGGPMDLDGYGAERAPRTVVGVSADRRVLYLVVVDGRSWSSIGASYTEMSHILASIGASEALNLDGGGSSTMWINGWGVVNVPSDGRERTVANHLGIESSGGGLQRHCPVGRAFAYVQHSLPGEGATVRAETGSTVSGTVRLRNDGTEPWTLRTTLAPLPRDSASGVATAGWDSPTRIDTADTTVPPGGTHDFQVSFRMPEAPGTTRVPLTLVEEGTTWFADSWGPADGAIALTLEALPRPPLRAEEVRFRTVEPVVMAPGEERIVTVLLRNTGSEAWSPGGVSLVTSEPRGRASAFATDAWLAPDEVATTTTTTGTDATLTLALPLHAPREVGAHTESFTLRTADGRWFADDGGPQDWALELEIDVRPPEDLLPGTRARSTGCFAEHVDEEGLGEATSLDTTACAAGPLPKRTLSPLAGVAVAVLLARRRRTR